MVSLPHPIQYQGSKRSLASTILRFLPGKVEQFIEPFAGTAAISVAVASRHVSQRFWLNDLNKGSIPLVHFSFKALILRALCARKMSALSPFVRVAQA
jgi:DNA adenine methylase